MKESSKILIAYDGSVCSTAALKDLRRAGLPASAEAVVLTVADVFIPPPDEELPGGPAVRIPEVEQHAREKAENAAAEAWALAEHAARLVKDDFPGWEVQAVVKCDAPAWAMIRLADHLNSDLVVVGSHRHSVAGGRLILGSTSQRVLHEASCSVRVARCSDGRREGPVRIVVGFNGSHAEVAVDSVVSREWPAESEVRLIAAGQATAEALNGPAERLHAVGLSVSKHVGEGDAAHTLIREAEEWGADTIFVGTRDLHGFQHLLHGSVAAAVAARAQCSVEVVREPKVVA